MRTYFPAIKPYQTHEVKVSPPHELYVEECGDVDGLPVIVLHGGPGAGCSKDTRRFFDPEKYRIILFDQRGCGRSKPTAELTDNTTAALISDIETIRELLGIDKWAVFGGSWGSTLALAYAQQHPEHVHGLILRGIFLGREQEIDWLYSAGADKIFPDHWEDFVNSLPHDKRDTPLQTVYDILTSDNEIARMAIAKSFATWEAKCATLLPSEKLCDDFKDPHLALCFSTICAHFMVNKLFLAPNQLLENMNKINQTPGIIVQGRYDIVCPMENAYTLYKHWQASELNIIPASGHSSAEPAIIDALVRATDKMHDMLGFSAEGKKAT